jgi:hypothetical protein
LTPRVKQQIPKRASLLATDKRRKEMSQITMTIVLLAGIALGNAMGSSVNTVQQPLSGDSTSQKEVSTVEPPAEEQAGGGEGGWPGF